MFTAYPNIHLIGPFLSGRKTEANDQLQGHLCPEDSMVKITLLPLLLSYFQRMGTDKAVLNQYTNLRFKSKIH